VVEALLPPEGTYQLTGSTLMDSAGVPTIQYNIIEFDLEQLRAQKLNAALAAFDDHRQRAFSWDFGVTVAHDDAGVLVGVAGLQTLQMRDDGVSNDVQNWLGAQVGALTAVSGGHGAVVLALKTTSNVWVQTTCSQVCAVLAGGDGLQTPMLSRQQGMIAKIGALKKAIAGAASFADLTAIDVTAGWPA
jgi:hypothetical protein